mgnify:CR=1 FL=1
MKKQVEKIQQTEDLKDKLRIAYRMYFAIEKKYIDVTKTYISNAKNEPRNELQTIESTLVELKEKEEPKKSPNLNVGEVDLGYTNHDNKSEKDKIDIEKEPGFFFGILFHFIFSISF